MAENEKVLTNSRLSVETRKLYFVGLVTKTILDKQQFQSNNSLHPAIKIFEDFFQVTDKFGNAGFRPYLFASRSLLAARIGKLIIEEKDSVRVINLFDEFVRFSERINSKGEEEPSTRKKEKTSLLKDVRKGLNR